MSYECIADRAVLEPPGSPAVLILCVNSGLCRQESVHHLAVALPHRQVQWSLASILLEATPAGRIDAVVALQWGDPCKDGAAFHTKLSRPWQTAANEHPLLAFLIWPC